jgi:hypothetical protein
MVWLPQILAYRCNTAQSQAIHRIIAAQTLGRPDMQQKHRVLTYDPRTAECTRSFAKPVTANSPNGIRHNDQVQVILFCLEEFKMQIMVRLAVQHGKNEVRGNYDWRAASECALHKKARHV